VRRKNKKNYVEKKKKIRKKTYQTCSADLF